MGFPRGGSVAPAPAGDDDLPDLAEADVWYSAAGSSGSPFPPAAARTRQAEADAEAELRAGRRGVVQGGLSRAFGDGAAGRPVATSAPVEVPACPPCFAAGDPEPA
ncbi:hypothetical protein U9M48_006462 [Paspalum notatum var. saurae]|uniref:Uncharacterized protein n=1 Tax=Paspalum notatum var. saurae TaxID=547442 RepID=A0AAQ3PT89_PASNO